MNGDESFLGSMERQQIMESYPSGLRGRFAKPLGRLTTVREFESHTLRLGYLIGKLTAKSKKIRIGINTDASKNIRNRVLVTVLRESLLKQLDNGAFEPKKLKREKVKETLLSFRRSPQKNVGSECTEGSLTTFKYV